MFPMFALARVRSCAGEARRARKLAKIESVDRASTSLCAQRGAVGQGNLWKGVIRLCPRNYEGAVGQDFSGGG